VIFLFVYLVALATTFAPAVRASRIYPAEALRYQ
jgi:ABC-type lipoprotein release transport system permease subunit